MNITRKIQKSVEYSLFKNKIVIIYGARQVGKTTLIKQIQKKYPRISDYLNCDEIDIRQALTPRGDFSRRTLNYNKIKIL